MYVGSMMAFLCVTFPFSPPDAGTETPSPFVYYSPGELHRILLMNNKLCTERDNIPSRKLENIGTALLSCVE